MDDNFFVEEEIKNAAIKVRIIPWRLIANVVVTVQGAKDKPGKDGHAFRFVWIQPVY